MAGEDGAEDGGGVGLDDGAAGGDGGEVGAVYGDEVRGGGGLDGWGVLVGVYFVLERGLMNYPW